MQTTAADVMDISGESDATKKMYGIDNPATKDFAIAVSLRGGW